jgi:hypothetical protein
VDPAEVPAENPGPEAAADPPTAADDDAEPADADDAEEQTPKKKRRWLRIPAAIVALLFASAGVTWFVAPARLDQWVQEISNRDEIRALLGQPVEQEAVPATTADVGIDEGEPEPIDPTPAFQSAEAAVRSARDVADTIDGLLYGAKAAGDEDAITTLSWMKWQREPTAVDSEELTRRLMERSEWQNARRVANWLIATRGESKRLRKLVDRSIERQFAEETVVNVNAGRFKRIVGIDTGHRPALFLEDGDGARWVVWPDLGQHEWRDDIAVYRLCQVMVCHFEIPETRPMTMRRKAWRALVKASDKPVAEMARRLRGDFDWEKKRVGGSIRRIPDAVPWPIEATAIWRPWLTAGTSPKDLAADAEEGHLRIAFVGAEKVFPELQGIAARQMARQISSMLLVDFLVGNWNRFAPREDQWGSRTSIDHGLIYSLDDTAAFLGEGSVRVKGRFSWVQRFSKATIDSLERLRAEDVDALLFPDATKEEKKKLEMLWSQRRRALRRVGKLVKEYGADDVFALDRPPRDNNGKP